MGRYIQYWSAAEAEKYKKNAEEDLAYARKWYAYYAQRQPERPNPFRREVEKCEASLSYWMSYDPNVYHYVYDDGENPNERGYGSGD